MLVIFSVLSLSSVQSYFAINVGIRLLINDIGHKNFLESFNRVIIELTKEFNMVLNEGAFEMNIKKIQNKSTRWMTKSAAILGTVAMMATAATPLVVAGQEVYTVVAGDNLYRIAVDNGTTEEHLMAINGLSTNLLQIGQKITLPSEGSNDDESTPTPQPTEGVHIVQAGENLWAIAQQNGTTEEYLMAINGLSTNLLQIGQKIVLSGDDSDYEPTPNQPVNDGVHVVVAGDNLWDIAQWYGTTEEQLMAWNGLSNNLLQIGDLISVYGPTDNVSVPSEPTPNQPVNDGVHVVVAGDNLWDIAQWYGTTEEQLMAWNGLASNFLQIGDRIAVYGPTEDAVPVESVETDTEAKTPLSDDVYVVQKGDNLWDIAQWYGTTEEYLMAINGLPNNLLQIGQEIRVVAADDTETSVPTTPTDTTEATDSTTRKVILPRVHVVREGEDTINIARQNFIDEEQLLEWNELTDSTIAAGDELFVTNPNIEPKVHVFAEGDTLDTLATEYKTTVKNIREWNFLKEDDELVIGDELIVTDPTANSYAATPGETLNEIAQAHNVTVQNLRDWNELPAEAILVNGTIYVSDPTGDKDEEADEATTEETTSQVESGAEESASDEASSEAESAEESSEN